jgi:GT2 family glycosyltransferase
MSEYDAIVLDLDGDPAMLIACLRSIAEQDVPPQRLLVVDNGSRVPTAERIGAQMAESVELLRLETNRGFAGGMNFALARSSSAPFVALINNDVRLEPQWSARLMERLASDDKCAAVQSVIVNDDASAVDGAGIALREGRIAQLGHGEMLSAVDAKKFWGVSATATLYRRKALEQGVNQVFDERFFAYYEDVELAARLRRDGWSFALVAEPLARHHGSATATQLGARATFLRARNRYYVARLHPVVRRSALLTEDLRRLSGHLLRGELSTFKAIAYGVVAGLFGRLK